MSLPDLYLITPEPAADAAATAQFLRKIDTALHSGIRLLQLRAPALDRVAYARLFGRVHMRCRTFGAVLLANASAREASELGATGVHLTSARLMACERRPLDAAYTVSAACHDLAQLQHAARIGVDFVTLSPVLATATHPQAHTLGWDGYAALVAQAQVPVYALGGMNRLHLPRVKQAGGQGIAAISSLWG